MLSDDVKFPNAFTIPFVTMIPSPPDIVHCADHVSTSTNVVVDARSLEGSLAEHVIKLATIGR